MNSKKKILIFIDWFLPGYNAGGPVRSIANLLEHINNFFDFFIVTSDTDYLQSEPYDNIESNKWLKFNEFVKIIYLSKQNITYKKISSLVRHQNYDLILINGIFSRYFSIYPLLIAQKYNKKIIVSPRGMLSKQAFSRKSLIKKAFVKITKIFSFYKTVTFHTTSKQECDDVKRLFPNNNNYFIPNLTRKFDSNFFSKIEKKKGSIKLVSIARISQEKNTKFAIEILSDIKEGEVEFDIYGGIYDKNYWNECKEILSNFTNVKVKYCGSVETEKVQETFANYHFAFMPSKAENFGHSILECLSSATPVIISNTTPWQNLSNIGVGWDIGLENKEKFVDVLKMCIDMDNNQFQQMKRNCLDFAKNYFEKNTNAEKYIKMFTDVAK